jgi:UDP-GlcNAc:undecaprenyl-phosphate GlcNAc-1-phosphate transferase
MYSLLFLAVTSFILSLALTPFIRNLCFRFGLVDLPDANRKLHSRPIPRVGGIAVALSFLISVILLTTTGLTGGWLILRSSPLIWKLAPAVVLVFAIGLWDDLAHLKAWHKLSGEIAAAAAAYFAGVHVVTVGGTSFSHWWSLPLTILWLVGCCNAVNLIDGVDGLAAGVSLVASLSMLMAAALQHNVLLAYATVPLVGCLLGFLRYNFSPATVFLGDCGSLTIGFLLGCYGVLWSQKSATVLGMAAPLMALAIPLLDTLLAISRRFLRRQPIFGADRGHIHHRLLDLGHSPRTVAMLLCGICAVASACSLCMSNNQLEIPVIVIFGVATWFGVQRLGYVEFDTAGRLLLQGSFRQLISSQIALRNFESKLAAASSPDDCWNVLQELSREFGLCYLEMRLLGRAYTTKPALCPEQERWHLEIPLSGGDYVLMAHEFNAMDGHNIVVSVPDMVRGILEAKRKAFAPFLGEKLLSTAAAGN